MTRRYMPAVLLLVGFLVLAGPVGAQTPLGPVTVGAGMQTSFAHTEPTVGTSTDQFLLNSARLYVNGPVTDKIKFMFNTEFDGGTNKIGVLDAVARIESSPQFNIWAGRFLPPSDRANLLSLWAPPGDAARDVRRKPGIALAALDGSDTQARLDAVATLRKSVSQDVRNRLALLLDKSPDGSFVESDETVRRAAVAAVETIDRSSRKAVRTGSYCQVG